MGHYKNNNNCCRPNPIDGFPHDRFFDEDFRRDGYFHDDFRHDRSHLGEFRRDRFFHDDFHHDSFHRENKHRRRNKFY